LLKQKEVNMFHVLDHEVVVYTGSLSQATQYVLEHFGARLDEAIRAGVRILYTDALHSFNQPRQELIPDYWDPIDD
jgi:hypothetical protein